MRRPRTSKRRLEGLQLMVNVCEPKLSPHSGWPREQRRVLLRGISYAKALIAWDKEQVK